jgi:hypothetical protein
MSEQQYRHRAEQMDAARNEFNRLWSIEMANQNIHSKPEILVWAEIRAWRIFLAAKGLRV